MMNDRIYSLLRKCTQESIDGSYANPYVDYGKFAELIIKECISIVNNQRDPSTLNYSPKQRTIDDIKYHFGIE